MCRCIVSEAIPADFCLALERLVSAAAESTSLFPFFFRLLALLRDINFLHDAGTLINWFYNCIIGFFTG